MLLSVLIGFALVSGAVSETCSSSSFTYYPSSDKCLVYFDDFFTYQEAVDKCTAEGAGLVMPRSAEATTDLISALGASTLSAVWLGLQDINLQKIYTYTDTGLPLSGYVNWNTPVGFRDSLKCVVSEAISGERKWFVRGCDVNVRVVCEAKPLEFSCDTKHGWVNMQTDRCFKAYKGHRKFNYNQAKSYCQKYSAFLATNLVSKQHRKEIGGLMNFSGHFWIGFHDQDNNAVYTDTNGVVMSGADQAFKRRLPRPGRCISFKRNRFFSKKCSRKQRLICQKSADVTLI